LKTRDLNFRINHQIKANEVRVIDEEGKQVGVLKLSEALALAQKSGLDLVEVAPNAKPPVAKIVDIGKFRYQEEKKLKKQSKAKVKKIKEFLDENYKVRVVVVFMGRQMNSKKFGYDLFKRITDELGEKIVVDMKPKFLGRHLVMTISPVKKTKRKEINAETKN